MIRPKSPPGYFEVREYSPSSFPAAQYFGLDFMCPCGCGTPGYLPLVLNNNQPKSEHNWAWDGDRVRPSLQPSIRRTHGCQFHGFLSHGVWTSAGDGPPVAADCYKGGSSTVNTLEPTMSAPDPKSEPETTQSTAVESTPPPDHRLSFPKLSLAPIGYAVTHAMHFFDGVLHQLWNPGHADDSKPVWVPVGGQDQDEVARAQSPQLFDDGAQTPVAPPLPTNDPSPRTSDGKHRAIADSYPDAPPRVQAASPWQTPKDVADAYGLAEDGVQMSDYGQHVSRVSDGVVLAQRAPRGVAGWVPPLGVPKVQDPAQTSAAAGQSQQAQGAVQSDRPPQVQE